MDVTLNYSDADGDVDGQGSVQVFADGALHSEVAAEDAAAWRLVLEILLGVETGLPYGTLVHFGFTITDGAGNVSNCADELIWTHDPKK